MSDKSSKKEPNERKSLIKTPKSLTSAYSSKSILKNRPPSVHSRRTSSKKSGKKMSYEQFLKKENR